MIYLSKRENQIYSFFQQNEDAIIEEVAVAFTKESRQNLYNPGFHRFKTLGILKESGESRLTSNGSSAKVYVPGPNFETTKFINPGQKQIIKEIRRLEAELASGGLKSPTKKAAALPKAKPKAKKARKGGMRSGKYNTPGAVFRALRDGVMSTNTYHNSIKASSSVTDARKEMYREGHAMWKQWKQTKRG